METIEALQKVDDTTTSKVEKSDPSSILLTLTSTNAVDAENPYTLLQLPEGFSVKDLQQAYLAEPSCDSSSAPAAVHLVTANQTFQVYQAGSSNAMVLLPPSSSAYSKTSDNESETIDEDTAAKRQKLNQQSAQWLVHPDGGATFWQVEGLPWKLGDLRRLLAVYDPKEKAVTGQSVNALATTLAVSPQLVRQGLMDLRAFNRPSTDENSSEEAEDYVLLSERIESDALNALVEALHSYDDYDSKGVSVSAIVSEIAKTTAVVPDNWEPILRHCVKALETVSEKNEPADGDRVVLDSNEVARVVARRLLQSRETWEEAELVAKWQAEVPGVGQEVGASMLKGLAIRDEQGMWKLLEASQLPSNLDEAWVMLWAAKEQWSTEELQPYLAFLSKESGKSPSSLLISSAVVAQTTDEAGGGKYYTKR